MSFYRTTAKSGATATSNSLNGVIAGKTISDSESTASIGTFANSQNSGSLDEEPATKEQLNYSRLSSIGKGEAYSLEAIRITSHVLVRCIHSVWFTVEWNDGGESWEAEFALQFYQPEMVYAYWDAKKGGREGATQFDLYHIFAILDHGSMSDHNRRRAKKLVYKIQWVGYDEKDHSWEPAAKIAGLVPKMKEEYDEMHGLLTLRDSTT
ncbi:Chromo/chromo shadow domain [Fusarium oxysporum f. sp. vasinfectum]|uniref:Chromo domain-containing protein n=1 Tax=Fusarium oxysporum f. sp. vasinfectum 25433 TaxID=1089449 RepID=X0KZS0_FUSOX|nr:hypothetical protein FOTG_12913 [Fusarium oxysporum f. sp. vasinfectum 25433]KAK2925093.1 Chromo/chromo shadow domain [Fusarium oxysporum f. sp. vasinfectum]